MKHERPWPQRVSGRLGGDRPKSVRYAVGVQFLRDLAKKILPKRFVEWYRRRRAVRQYLRSLGYEIYERTIRLELEDVEGRIAARRDGFYERMVADVLERTELVLQDRLFSEQLLG